MNILEYGVPARWCREFTVQGFDPVDQGLKNLWSSVPVWSWKHKADTPTKPTGKKKFYCNMHGHNKTHDTKDCFELKRRAKRKKQGKTCTDVYKVTYKDLNVFVNAKVTVAVKKAKKNLKQQKKEKQVKLNAFDKFCTLNVESSDNKDKPSPRASIDVDNKGSSDSCLLSNDNSNSNNK
eukprot:69819-Ditylum_brightwellii.AAC.1